ncbi:MAG: hypothetical protein ACK56F_05040, partial [bacterium]
MDGATSRGNAPRHHSTRGGRPPRSSRAVKQGETFVSRTEGPLFRLFNDRIGPFLRMLPQCSRKRASAGLREALGLGEID